MSTRRYMVRRLGALIVLGGLVVGAGWGVNLIRDAGDSAAGDSTPSTSTDAGQVSSSPSSSSATAATGTSGGGSAESDESDESDESAEPDQSDQSDDDVVEPPTPDNPATVYMAGDSDAGTFGPYLGELLGGTGVVETTLDYKVSSGLARPDFFDWQEHLETEIPEIDPDIVVVTFGGNDAQGIADKSGDFIVEPADIEPSEWRAEYGRRVGEIMDYLMQDGRTVIWVGIPNTASHARTERLRIQDEVVRDQVEQRPDVVFVDTWKRFSGRDGNYADYVIDPRDGQGKPVRHDDDFHLNETGAEILALDIAEVVRIELRDRGADI